MDSSDDEGYVSGEHDDDGENQDKVAVLEHKLKDMHMNGSINVNSSLNNSHYEEPYSPVNTKK